MSPRKKNARDQQNIAERAYGIYASRGYTDGQDVDDWLMAESQLQSELSTGSTRNVHTGGRHTKRRVSQSAGSGRPG